MRKPKIKSAQQIIDLLKLKEISNIVITPGSRNAPLTIAFTEDDYFTCYSIVDERSAAFFALGISQQTNKATVVVGTSGSALLNYYPAVAEAFYSDIPLIIISADRPQKWIDQSDGQTIRQNSALDKHVLKSINLSENDDDEGLWYNSRILNQALNTCLLENGPIHINVPFKEPLYEFECESESEGSIVVNTEVAKSRAQLAVSELEIYADKWNNSSKKIVLIGVKNIDEQLQVQLDKLSKDPSVLVLTETTSNVHSDKFISNIDLLISGFSEAEACDFAPDILITVGKNIVSKRIKALFRKFKLSHWHIGGGIDSPDTYKNLTAIFDVDSDMFFSQLFFLYKNKESDYSEKFMKIYKSRLLGRDEYLKNIDFSDLKIFEHLSENIPSDFQIQSANSSVVRYFQLFNLKNKNPFFCNRGTSGIEGSTSTSIGAAVASNKPVIMVSGDLSFFYDSNALWNNYIPNNYKLIVINNSGGSIFKIIPGPSNASEFETFFRTKHDLKANNLAEMYNFDYYHVENLEDFKSSFEKILQNNTKPQLLEVNTSNVENEEILAKMWKSIS